MATEIHMRAPPRKLIKAIDKAIGGQPVDEAVFALTLCLKVLLDQLPPTYHASAVDIINAPPGHLM